MMVVCPTCAREFDENVSVCPNDGSTTVSLEPTRVSPSGPTRWKQLATTVPGKTVLVDPLIGQQVGEFTVKGVIGEGGCGVVYEGEHPLIGKRAAIKCLKTELAANPEEAARLLTEARAANAIGHRGIIDIFGFGTLPDGRQYFAMEFLNGTSLSERIDRGPQPVADVLSLMNEILPPLAAAHAAGVIHRDLKPSNIFVVDQPDGTSFVKLLDFGLAKKGIAGTAPTPQTSAARFLGTPEFIAPEQARGEPVGPRTDLYAFGIIVFELLTGRAPFVAMSPWEVLRMQLEQPAPALSTFRADVPRELEQLVLQLMEKDPADRPASAEAVREVVKRLRKSLRTDSGTALVLPALDADATERNDPPRPVARQRRLANDPITEPERPAAARPGAAAAAGPIPRTAPAARGTTNKVPQHQALWTGARWVGAALVIAALLSVAVWAVLRTRAGPPPLPEPVTAPDGPSTP